MDFDLPPLFFKLLSEEGPVTMSDLKTFDPEMYETLVKVRASWPASQIAEVSPYLESFLTWFFVSSRNLSPCK